MGALNLLCRATPTTARYSAVVKVIKLINWSTLETCKNMAGTMEGSSHQAKALFTGQVPKSL